MGTANPNGQPLTLGVMGIVMTGKRSALRSHSHQAAHGTCPQTSAGSGRKLGTKSSEYEP